METIVVSVTHTESRWFSFVWKNKWAKVNEQFSPVYLCPRALSVTRMEILQAVVSYRNHYAVLHPRTDVKLTLNKLWCVGLLISICHLLQWEWSRHSDFVLFLVICCETTSDVPKIPRVHYRISFHLRHYCKWKASNFKVSPPAADEEHA